MFVLRARRITEHPLVLHHRDLMESLYKGELKLVVNVDKTTGAVISAEQSVSFPPEELMDSLAARVRPLLLEREPVHFPRVLDALSELVQPELIANAHAEHSDRDVQWWRDRWDHVASRTGDPQGWALQLSDGTLVTDRRLADRWLYSDLVHADPIEPSFDEISFEDRFRAGCEVVSRICSVVDHFSQLVTFLYEQGVLAIQDRVFTSRVVLAETERKQAVTVRTAPVGTSLETGPWPLFNPASLGPETE